MLGTVAFLGIALYYYWERKQTKESYEVAYAKFAANPTDVRLRDNALAKAELYSRSVGEDSSERGIHLASLRQSIETLHRSAKDSVEMKKLVADKSTGPADRLAELQKMLDQELISEQEFQTKRTQILDEV